MIDKIKSYIESRIEENCRLSEEDIEHIIDLSVRYDAYEANIGFDTSRLNEHNPREVAFSETWKEENYPQRGVNFGQGQLQDIFIEQISVFPMRYKVLEVINNRDRKIVATVIQWLGSNCGMGFLEKSLNKC